jgi:hypothetical protein
MRYVISFIVFAVVIHFLASMSVHPTLDPSISGLSQSLIGLNPKEMFQSFVGLIQGSISVISDAATPSKLIPVMFFFALLHG